VASEETLDELRAALEGLVSRLDDLIYDELAEAVDDGQRERPALERRLTRVRNALVRARALLSEE